MIGISTDRLRIFHAAVALAGQHVRVVVDATASPICFEGEDVFEQLEVVRMSASADQRLVPTPHWYDPPEWSPAEPWRGSRPPQGRRGSSRYLPRPRRSKCGAYHRG